MIVRAQQALHLQGLEPVAETRADPHSYGFRRNRGTQDAIACVFHWLARKTSACWILEGDILGCFDNFGHGWLDSHFIGVVEGIGKTTLRRAAGHIPGTALPGQPGNVGISGHRDTLFRPLKDLKIKDEIQFSTVNGDFRYVVESLTVVDPNNVGVLAPTSENQLTLVTCYPFFYIGAAPKRFVVRAWQIPAQALARSIVK